MELRVPEDCPQELVDLCLACTELDRAARPSIREVVERLTLIPDAMPGQHAVHDRGSPDSQTGRAVHAAHDMGSPDSQADRTGGGLSAGVQHDQPAVPAGQDDRHAVPDLHAVQRRSKRVHPATAGSTIPLGGPSLPAL